MALFYILDTRQVVGNEALWWGPNRSGYTTNLDEAGLYTDADTTGLRNTDIPVPRDVALGLAHSSVIIAETIRRREAEQTQLMNLMRERAQSNPMIFRLNRAIQEAWKEPLKVKPRSKRGQRVRRWR